MIVVVVVVVARVTIFYRSAHDKIFLLAQNKRKKYGTNEERFNGYAELTSQPPEYGKQRSKINKMHTNQQTTEEKK